MPSLQKNTTKLISSAVLLTYLAVAICSPLTYASAQEEGLYFIHTDHLGSTTVITDKDGEVVQHTRNYPYGADRATQEDSNAVTERKFTGQIRDSSTSLYYYNARYYDPTLGSFISADPVNDSLNRFAYVRNNPVMFKDFSGNQAVPPVYLPTNLRDMKNSWEQVWEDYTAGELNSMDRIFIDAVIYAEGGMPDYADADWFRNAAEKHKVGAFEQIVQLLFLGASVSPPGVNHGETLIRSVKESNIFRNVKRGLPSAYTDYWKLHKSPTVKNLNRKVQQVVARTGSSTEDAISTVVRNELPIASGGNLQAVSDLLPQAGSLDEFLQLTGGTVSCSEQAAVSTVLARMNGLNANYVVIESASGYVGGHAVSVIKSGDDFVKAIDPSRAGVVGFQELLQESWVGELMTIYGK